MYDVIVKHKYGTDIVRIGDFNFRCQDGYITLRESHEDRLKYVIKETDFISLKENEILEEYDNGITEDVKEYVDGYKVTEIRDRGGTLLKEIKEYPHKC